MASDVNSTGAWIRSRDSVVAAASIGSGSVSRLVILFNAVTGMYRWLPQVSYACNVPSLIVVFLTVFFGDS